MLKEWILESHKDDWKTNVYGQCKSWLDSGLQPRAVTRDLDWGVKVPVEGAEGKVLYVWFDAPIGYISATREWSQQTGKDWEPYWKSDDTKLVHFIGKDNMFSIASSSRPCSRPRGAIFFPTTCRPMNF
jgi:methionyl-tRNA synthetase